MKVTPEELFLQNLEEKWPVESFWYIPKERALAELKMLTGVDHGLDAQAWRKWMLEKRELGAKRTD